MRGQKVFRLKIATVLLSATMCLSVWTAPVFVSADETTATETAVTESQPSETETSEYDDIKPSETEETTSSEETEPSQTDKFTVSRKKSVRTVTGMCGDKTSWLLNDEGTLTVSGYGDMDTWDSADLVPWKNYKESIKSVVVSSGVTSVGARAFDGCKNLETINIAETVTKIGIYAFADCTSLKSAVLDENLYRTSPGIFYGCTGVEVSYIANYPIKVYGGTSDVSKASAGTTVTLTVGEAPEGKVFDKWTVDRGEVELTVVDEKTATFVMPASYVEITASFRDKEPQNNTLTVRGRNAKLKEKKLKKKAQKISRAKVMTVRNPQGRVTYRLMSVSKSRYKKYFKVNARNGVVTVKKKLKKGTYTVRCRVAASGNTEYKGVSRIVSFKITVK
jgi:hypothetical protein